MEKLLNTSIIKGFVFSAYEKLGPQPIYMFPEPIDQNDIKDEKNSIEETFNLTLRDYTQISIKNLSLLIGDGTILDNVDVEKYQYFGIIPFPDFNLTSLTFFHFVNVRFSEKPLATAFSLLVDENKRSFLYNNINRLKNIVLDFFQLFDKELIDGYKPYKEVEHLFKSLLENVVKIEETPTTPFTTQRKMKIIFAGLDDSGKTSFLLSIDRKFSKLMGLKPTIGAQVSSINAFGANIFLWDLGGQVNLRKSYLDRAQIYLYEADLMFYFIDIKNKSRFDESIDYLQEVNKIINNFNQVTPIIYILSKGDPDIIESKEIQENLQIIKEKLNNIEQLQEIHVTTIFQIYSILRAFSSGLSKLSPNKDLIDHNLKTFSMETAAYLTLILSSDGLVLAEDYLPEAVSLTKIPHSAELLNIFEVTAPQFAILFKIFSKYKALRENEAIFKVADSTILFKRINVYRYEMYILFLLDDESKKEKINQLLPAFLKRTQDLLIRYIS
ncbi:MAG: ADP-ribosylation factor-like protein [Candidatus Heimdallarchaeota archaeon]